MQHNYTDEEIRTSWKNSLSLHAFLDALPERPQAQSILADDGRSLGQVAFDAGNAVQKIKFPEQEIETWEESAEVHEMIEAAAQAVAAVVESRMIRRMEAVPKEELEKVYWDGNEVVAGHTALKRVRARLIAAARGEGQDKPVGVNEPPSDEKQPDLSGESEKQDEPAWTPHDGGPCPLKDEEVDVVEVKWHSYERTYATYLKYIDGWELDEGESPEGNMITHYRVLKWKPGFGPEAKPEPAQAEQEPAQPWTPAVGDTVRLKSGGPVMTVTAINTNGLCAVTEAVGQWFAGKTVMGKSFPAACLTPVQP